MANTASACTNSHHTPYLETISTKMQTAFAEVQAQQWHCTKVKNNNQREQNATTLGAALEGGEYGTADSSSDSMTTPRNMTPDTDNMDNHNKEMVRKLILRRE